MESDSLFSNNEFICLVVFDLNTATNDEMEFGFRDKIFGFMASCRDTGCRDALQCDSTLLFVDLI